MATNSSENHHKDHAIHNEEVYNYLRKNLDYIDWVITVAFYTALHYVENEIFPCVIKIGGKDKEFDSLEEYHDYFGGGRSLHATRKKAVKEKLPTCRSAYEGLFNLCMTARYHQYKYDEPQKIDRIVEKWLHKIRKACTENN